MKRVRNLVAGCTLVAGMLSGILLAQEEETFGEDSKLNTNIAMVLSAPLNPTARFSDFGWGLAAGAGLNFSRHHAFVGEFMWNRLHLNNRVLVPLRLALQSPDIGGHSGLFAITANYRFELRGKTLGTYFIGGGGFYYRHTSITKTVVSGTGITCTPEWIWWGATCESGFVTSDQTLTSFSSGVFGGNAGIGFTVKIGEEPRYRFYMEARYHYAPHKPVKTELIPITIGVRF